MPALVHEAFRPFFPGNAVPLSERITAATLLCFMDMPGGLLDAGALEVLVNSTAHLGPRHTSTAQAIAGDRALHRKREANLHTIAHNVHLEKVEKKKKLHAQLASEDLDPHGVHGGGVHHHHQHVTTLGGSAVGGKRIVAQAKVRTALIYDIRKDTQTHKRRCHASYDHRIAQTNPNPNPNHRRGRSATKQAV